MHWGIIATAFIVGFSIIGCIVYLILQVHQSPSIATQKFIAPEHNDNDESDLSSEFSDEDSLEEARHHQIWYQHQMQANQLIAPPPQESSSQTIQIQPQPCETGTIEEYNDIRWFDSQTIPITLTRLNVTNCVGCELLEAVIPRGDYVINSRNQTFQIRQPFEASLQTFTDITIPEGDYTAATLASTITSLVATAGFTNVTFAFSTLTKNITITDDSVLDVSFNTLLAYDLGFGTTTNLNLGSVQYPSSATDSYVVTSSNNTIEVSVSAGAYVTYTIATGTYTASTLATALNTALSLPGLTAAYISDGSPSIAIYHSGFAFDVRPSSGFLALMGITTLVQSVPYNTTTSRYYETGNRVDLFGSRYVQIRTRELNQPDLHHRGILHSMFLQNEITSWQYPGGDSLRLRTFAMPRSIRNLTIEFKERHPVHTDEDDFTDMDLNGLAVSICICFKRLRYTNEAQSSQLSMH